MRVAFVTHQLPDGRTDHGPGLLKGRYAGGAEMSTEELLAQAPDGVEVTVSGRSRVCRTPAVSTRWSWGRRSG